MISFLRISIKEDVLPFKAMENCGDCGAKIEIRWRSVIEILHCVCGSLWMADVWGNFRKATKMDLQLFDIVTRTKNYQNIDRSY